MGCMPCLASSGIKPPNSCKRGSSEPHADFCISCASIHVHITDVCVVSLDLQTADVGSIVSITGRPNQLGRNEIAIVTSLLENQTAIAAGNANVSEPQNRDYRDSIGKTLTIQEEVVRVSVCST